MKFLKNFKNTFVFTLIQEYALVAFTAFVILALGSIGLGAYILFAPSVENARRHVFESSKAYNDGMQQELQSYFLEYQKADEAGKQNIRAVIQHQYASYPLERLPNHLRSFVSEILNPVSF